MLDLFRKQKTASKWILGVITGVMALGIVVFFIPAPSSVSDSSSGATVAKVGPTEISAASYANALRRLLKNATYPKDMEFLKRFGVPKQLLEDLITQKLLTLEAERYGLSATDQEVRERILSYPVFQPLAGSFNLPTYARILQQLGTTVDEFEESVRHEILTSKLRALITDGLLVSSEEVEQEYRNENETVKLEYVLFDPVELEKTMKVSTADLRVYLDLHVQNFQVPEQRQVKYILVDMSKVRSRTQVSDEELRKFYEENRIKYFVGDRNRVSHILFKTTGQSTEEIDKTRQRALEVLRKVRAGGDFRALAKEYSEDDSTKVHGGELGWVDQTTPFVAEFKQVALSLGVGAVSDLVTTKFGFHIIKVFEHQPAHTQSFEEAKELIRPTYMAQRTDREASALANDIFKAVSAKPGEFDAVAKQYGAEVRTVPPFAKGDSVPEIGSNPDFESKVFSLRLKQVGEPVRVAPGFVLPLLEHIILPHTPELSEIRDRVEKAYKQFKAADLAKSKAEAFAKSLASGKAFAAAAKAAGYKSATSEAFRRNASEKSLGNTTDITPAAFRMNAGEMSAGLRLGTKYIVFRVDAKQEIKPAEFEKAKVELTSRLREQKRNTVFTTFQEDLLIRYKREGKVQVNEKALEAALNRRII